MLQLLRASFNIGLIFIVIAFLSIPIGWLTFASIIGVIGAVLAIIGLAPVLLIMILAFLYAKDVKDSEK